MLCSGYDPYFVLRRHGIRKEKKILHESKSFLLPSLTLLWNMCVCVNIGTFS